MPPRTIPVRCSDSPLIFGPAFWYLKEKRGIHTTICDICHIIPAFFDLPAERKLTAAVKPTSPGRANIYRGYTSLVGDTTEFAENEMYDIGPELASPRPPVHGAEILNEPNAWPDAEPYDGWQAEMRQHYADLHAVAMAVMLSTGRAFGFDDSALRASFQSNNSTLRLLNYPPREGSARVVDGLPIATVRHTDGAGVSLLWQREPGLQAEGPDGVWRDVPQYPGSISVHLGDLLEMMTGGRIPATPHRVLDHGGERRSVGFFLEPSLDASVTGTGELRDSYAWRLLERLRSYPALRSYVPEPAPLDQ